jgi:hypothetical protein
MIFQDDKQKAARDYRDDHDALEHDDHDHPRDHSAEEKGGHGTHARYRGSVHPHHGTWDPGSQVILEAV